MLFLMLSKPIDPQIALVRLKHGAPKISLEVAMDAFYSSIA